jgi:hypothetical protein
LLGVVTVTTLAERVHVPEAHFRYVPLVADTVPEPIE